MPRIWSMLTVLKKELLSYIKQAWLEENLLHDILNKVNDSCFMMIRELGMKKCVKGLIQDKAFRGSIANL